MRILVLLFILSACYVEDGRQGEVKSLASAIEDNCTEEYEYLRFELDGIKGKGTAGKKVVMNFRVKKSDLEDCKFSKIEACVGGEVEELQEVDHWDDTISEVNGRMIKGIGIETKGTALSSKDDHFVLLCRDNVGVKDSKILGMKYTAKRWSATSGNSLPYRFGGMDTNLTAEAGKRLKSYQDSQCWPESKSQCEAGSGQ